MQAVGELPLRTCEEQQTSSKWMEKERTRTTNYTLDSFFGEPAANSSDASQHNNGRKEGNKLISTLPALKSALIAYCFDQILVGGSVIVTKCV